MSNNSAAAAENAGANSDEFHSADEADGATRPPRQPAGSDIPHRRDRASSSSSASDSEPEANRAALSETSVQQSSDDHARSQPEAMQHEGTVLAAAPPRELDDHEKQVRDSNDDKSESPAVEAYHSPSAEAVADHSAPPADSGEIVATTETIAENTPKETADSPAVEGASEAHLSPSPAADLKINPEAQENETQKSPDTAVAAVEDALISCSIADSDQAPGIVHDDFSLAVGGEETAENGVHEETEGDEMYALEGDRDVLPTDEGPSVLELSSKDDPRVSPRPPQDHQDNAHVVELDDDGQYDDDDDDDDDRASGEDGATPDDDEDVHNPAFIPKVGRFYMHDRRTFDDHEEEEKKLDARPGRADAVDKWRHDRFEERSQRPKENTELVHRYGHDIRSDDKAPEGDVPPRDRTDNSNRRARGVPRAGASRGRPGRGTRGSSGGVPQQRRSGGGGFDAADFPPLQSRSNDGAGESYQPRGGRARGPSSGFRGNADRRGTGWAPRRGSDRRPDDGNQTASYQTREFRNSGRATGRGGAPPSERTSQRDPAVASGRFGGDRRNADDSRDSHSTRYANQQHDCARRNDDSRASGHQQRSGEGQQQSGGRGGGKRYSAQRPQQHQSADGPQDVRQQDSGNQFRQAPPIAYAQQQQQQPYFEPNYQRPPPFAGPAQFGGQYGGVPAPVAPYSGPQELYHRPQGPYMAGPAVQPRQPTGAVYFDPVQQRDRQQQRSSRPHKGIPIVAPDESVQ